MHLLDQIAPCLIPCLPVTADSPEAWRHTSVAPSFPLPNPNVTGWNLSSFTNDYNPGVRGRGGGGLSFKKTTKFGFLNVLFFTLNLPKSLSCCASAVLGMFQGVGLYFLD